MNETFNVVQARIVGAMEALAIARSSAMDQGLDDSVAIISAETLLRRALRGLCDRFGPYEKRPATRLLMDSLVLEGPEEDETRPMPFRLLLPELASDERGGLASGTGQSPP
jgi:hypothetical protein